MTREGPTAERGGMGEATLNLERGGEAVEILPTSSLEEPKASIRKGGEYSNGCSPHREKRKKGARASMFLLLDEQNFEKALVQANEGKK